MGTDRVSRSVVVRRLPGDKEVAYVAAEVGETSVGAVVAGP
jgi:hypothetical protein